MTVPAAGGSLLQLPNAQAGGWNISKSTGGFYPDVSPCTEHRSLLSHKETNPKLFKRRASGKIDDERALSGAIFLTQCGAGEKGSKSDISVNGCGWRSKYARNIHVQD